MELLSEKLDVQSTRMDGMRSSQAKMMVSQDEMRREMEELHAQNQLLLSKISALSSQNSNAPGIFDGADRRKREADGKNGPAAGVGQRQLAFFDMYVISLKSALIASLFPMVLLCRDYPMVGRFACCQLC